MSESGERRNPGARALQQGLPRLSPPNVRGLVRLTLDAARLVTDVVEDVHATVLTRVGIPLVMPRQVARPGSRGRTSGIPRLVYRAIHAGYDATEAVTNAAAGLLRDAEAEASLHERERMLAVLNGVWGDHLAASGNPLATSMCLRYEGKALSLERSRLAQRIETPSRRLLIFVHGLCMNDASWTQGRRNPGAELGKELGYTPLHLVYNTGLHVSTNGKLFGELLEKLVAEWPVDVEEVTIVAFSMGGLVTRSAAHYGALEGRQWVGALRRIVFLGTPHHGSRLERAGNWAGDMLSRTPYSAPFRRLGATRSAGITDLRHGSLLDEDWEGVPRAGSTGRLPAPVALPPGVKCYAAAATMGARAGDAKDWLFGDGLVPLESALGAHHDSTRALVFPEERRWIGYRMKHLELLVCPEVYGLLRGWLRD